MLLKFDALEPDGNELFGISPGDFERELYEIPNVYLV